MNLPSYFDTFLSSIQPKEERVTAASIAHNTLRTHLSSDETLKYSVDESFLSGSYARSTAIDPIKDVDVILVLEEKNISEDAKTPSPKEVLSSIKASIEAFYNDVELRDQRRSIQVKLEDDGICMDIVPAIAPVGKDEPLWVPDRKLGEWIQSHPSGHLTYTTQRNKETGGNYVLVVKAMKWWKTFKLDEGLTPKSFLLEAMVGLYIPTSSPNALEAFKATVQSLLAGLKDNFEASKVPSIPDPGLPGNCLAISCGWTVESFKYFYGQISDLWTVIEKAETAESKLETAKYWKSIFGDKYPDAPVEAKVEKAQLLKSILAPARELVSDGAMSGRNYKFSARIEAFWKKNGEWVRHESNGPRLDKEVQLKFQLVWTDVKQPYKVRWRVRNHGREALRVNVLSFCSSPSESHEHPQRTAYRGYHYMDCELLVGDKVVALARHVVNIG